MEISIKSIDELIYFIEVYELDFKTHLIVLNSFTGQPIYWCRDVNKMELLKWLMKNNQDILLKSELPLFVE